MCGLAKKGWKNHSVHDQGPESRFLHCNELKFNKYSIKN